MQAAGIYRRRRGTPTPSPTPTPTPTPTSYTETFTSGSDVLLSSHTGEIGGWTKNRVADTATVSITAATGRARSSSTTASTVYRLTTMPAEFTTDYAVESVILFTSLDMGGVGARTGASDRRGYYFFYNTSTPGWIVQRTDASLVNATLGAPSNTLLPGAAVTRTVRLEVSGSGATVTIRGYVDGNLLVDITDSAANRLVDQGYAAIYPTRQAAEFDSFTITTM